MTGNGEDKPDLWLADEVFLENLFRQVLREVLLRSLADDEEDEAGEPTVH